MTKPWKLPWASVGKDHKQEGAHLWLTAEAPADSSLGRSAGVKREMGTVDTHMKGCSIFLIIREKQVKQWDDLIHRMYRRFINPETLWTRGLLWTATTKWTQWYFWRLLSQNTLIWHFLKNLFVFCLYIMISNFVFLLFYVCVSVLWMYFSYFVFVCIFCLFLFVSLFSCLLSKVRKKAVDIERMRKIWEKMREGNWSEYTIWKHFFQLKEIKNTY